MSELRRYEIKCNCQDCNDLPHQERIYCDDGRNVAAIDADQLVEEISARNAAIDSLQSEIAMLRGTKSRPMFCEICDEGNPATIQFGSLVGPSYVVCSPCARLYTVSEMRTRLDLKVARRKVAELSAERLRETMLARLWRKRAADRGDLTALAQMASGEEVSLP